MRYHTNQTTHVVEYWTSYICKSFAEKVTMGGFEP